MHKGEKSKKYILINMQSVQFLSQNCEVLENRGFVELEGVTNTLLKMLREIVYVLGQNDWGRNQIKRKERTSYAMGNPLIVVVISLAVEKLTVVWASEGRVSWSAECGQTHGTSIRSSLSACIVDTNAVKARALTGSENAEWGKGCLSQK